MTKYIIISTVSAIVFTFCVLTSLYPYLYDLVFGDYLGGFNLLFWGAIISGIASIAAGVMAFRKRG